MPKVEKIALELKMSRQVSDGPWTTKSLGLRAEAALSPHETLQMASEELYHDLAAQLRLLWGSEKPLPRQEAQPAVGDEEIDEPPAPPVDPSWCDIHKVKMKKWTAKDGSGRSWYSHPVGERGAPDSFWCQGEQE